MRTKLAVTTATVAMLMLAGTGLLAQRGAGPRRDVARVPPASPAAAAAGDVKSVLFNWMWYTGMLRGVQEIDAVATLELQATGMIRVAGQPCTVTTVAARWTAEDAPKSVGYRVSVNYQTPGMRVQYTCMGANGQMRKGIEVVSGQFAWDEDIVGAGLVPGKGKATPMPNALDERLIRLWASPQGAPKAAAAAGANTKVAVEGGKAVVTFPIPGVAGAMAKATLSATNQAERVEVRQGTTLTEFTYDKYADFNPPDDRIDAFYAGHIVEKRDGMVVRDLTTAETEVGNLYVVIPVPESVKAAPTPRASAPSLSPPTPQAANGKPDLSGMWGGGFGGGGDAADADKVEGVDIVSSVASRRCAPNQTKCDEHTNQSYDGEFTARMDTNRPLYKPEYWDRVQYLDVNTNKEDPIFECQSQGVPRLGGPTKIVQTANEVILFYGGGDVRFVPTDGRAHDPVKARDVSFLGDAIGRWEGDTFVVDSVGFNDLTWLARGGYFHTDRMHVVERFRREGNTLHYQATVEDPQVLVQPWVMNERQLRLNTNPKAMISEPEPCHNYDKSEMVLKIRH